MIRLGPIGLVALAACSAAQHPSDVAIQTAHKRACEAKGELIIERDLMRDEPCGATAFRLEALVRTDEDCTAFYGDASISIDLCGPVVGSAPDGGAGPDGGD